MGSFDEFVSQITNVTVFTESFANYRKNLSAPLIITTVIVGFMLFAAFDFMCGNRFGYGVKYVDAWKTLPDLAMAMVGIISISPVLKIILQPLVSPIYKGLGADPSMFAGTLLACDMGGYQLALQMAGNDTSVGLFSGLVLGSMLGATLVFNIPVGISMIKPEQHIYFAYGTLVGIALIPFGCFAGGMAMNLTPYKMTALEVIKNLVPVIIIAVVISLCLFFFPNGTLKGFMGFAKVIDVLKVVGAILAIFQQNTYLHFPLLDVMINEAKSGHNYLNESISAIGSIAEMLCGTLPLVYFIVNVCGKPLEKAGGLIGITSIDSACVVSALASSIPCFQMYEKMSEKGLIVASAFIVGASFVFGDHLGFIGGVMPSMIVPVLIGKLTSGILALIITPFITKFFIAKIEADKLKKPVADIAAEEKAEILPGEEDSLSPVGEAKA